MKYTLGIFRVNRQWKAIDYREVPFQSLEEVKWYLRRSKALCADPNTYVDPWTKSPDGEYRHIFVCRDFALHHSLVAFNTTPYEDHSMVNTGWLDYSRKVRDWVVHDEQ